MWAVWVAAGIAGVVLSYVIGISLYAKGMKKKDLLYPLEGAEIGIERDIEYKRAEDKALLMDLYRPSDVENPPVVVLIHGEGAESFIRDAKDWALYRDYGRLLAENGLAAVSFNHRPGGITVGFKDIDKAAGDVTDLAAYVRSRAGEWGVDGERICVWAFSAGGVYLNPFFRNTPAYIKCLVSFYGLLAATAFTKKNQDYLSGYDPENYLAEDTLVPVLAVQAGKDRPQIARGTERFLAAAKAKGIAVKHILYAEGKHAFDVMNDTEETRRIIGETVRFIKDSLT